MFITMLEKDPLFFFGAFFTVVVSVCLHELAHGWAAIHQGDDTPIRLGHMTFNPLVHMGAVSLILFAVAGIAFGAMPVDPTRFRSRYGEAFVAAAGPAMNLLLAVVSLLALGLWMRWGGPIDPETVSPYVVNGRELLWIFSTTNVALCLFNLLPIPPLDGSAILGNFHHGFRRWTADPKQQSVMLVVLLVVLFGASRSGWGPFEIAGRVCNTGLHWLML